MTARPDSLDRLLARLNIGKVRQNDLPTYEVIAALIKRVKELSGEVGSGGSGTTIINEQTFIQQLSLEDGGSSEEGMIVPGQRGDKGDTGAIGPTGAEGPPFPALIYLESDQAEDVMPIPGPVGPTGATGNTGAAGPQSIGFVFEGEPAEDVIPIPGRDGSSGSAGWTLIESRAMTTNVNEDFINLSVYSEILVICIAITKSVTGVLILRVSEDNGSTFLSASGDYLQVPTGGNTSNQTSIAMHTTNATAARSAIAIISGLNKSAQKFGFSYNQPNSYIVVTTNPCNAIRVTSSGVAAQLNGGTIVVYGR